MVRHGRRKFEPKWVFGMQLERPEPGRFGGGLSATFAISLLKGMKGVRAYTDHSIYVGYTGFKAECENKLVCMKAIRKLREYGFDVSMGQLVSWDEYKRKYLRYV